MHDHHWLYNAPSCIGAVRWSEDNHLAVAAAHSVVLLNPGAIAGARAWASTPQGLELDAMQVDGVPKDLESSAQLVWAVGKEATVTGEGQRTCAVRSIDWSPSGCTQQAGCLLATVTTDHKVGCRRPFARAPPRSVRCVQAPATPPPRAAVHPARRCACTRRRCKAWAASGTWWPT